jgi:uncharacterized protein
MTGSAKGAAAATKVLARVADKIQSDPAAWASLTAYAALYGESAEAKPEGALNSADYVKATARGASHADHDEILVTLSIDASYHVNANPASADYLIPTVVTVPSIPDAKITYPVGQVFKPRFSPEEISVYEGSIAIKAELPKGKLASAASEPLFIKVQACTDQDLPAASHPHCVVRSVKLRASASRPDNVCRWHLADILLVKANVCF